MLAGIGVIIILKQLPHAFGFDKDAAGNFSFLDTSGGNTFASLAQALDFFTPGAVVIALVASVETLLCIELGGCERLVSPSRRG